MTAFGAQSLALVGGGEPPAVLQNIVAVRGSNAAWSPDGITWNAAAGVPALTWNGVAFAPNLGSGQGRYVAVSGTGGGLNAVMTSDDGGQNWTQRATPVSRNWLGVAWSELLGVFAATATGGGTNGIMSSPDGIVWTQGTGNQSNSCNQIKYQGGRFFGGGQGGTAGLYQATAAGGPWASGPLNTGLSASLTPSVFSSGIGLYVVGVFDGANERVFRSADAGNLDPWVQSATLVVQDNVSYAYSASLNLIVALGGPGSAQQIFTTVDGITWTPRTAPDANVGRSVKWSELLGSFVAVTDGNSVWLSADGVTWTAAVIGASNWLDVMPGEQIYD